jgi:glutamate mutase epsilon subunit
MEAGDIKIKQGRPGAWMLRAALLQIDSGTRDRRTAITSVAMFLCLNGCRLTASNPELEQFTFAALLEDWSVDRLAAWFEEHTHKIS